MSDNARLYALTREECGSLKMLLDGEISRLRKQTPQNETMIALFSNVLVELRNGRPLS
ncbi:hypothetical protein EVC14_039 [Rhizobium phage RHph_I3_18]|nr:hypothetical protein EVC14_039 [Rhizobium phage RHph_I3_18]